jgi:hypothetical protein
VLGLELGMISWEPLMSFRVQGFFPLPLGPSLGAVFGEWRRVQAAFACMSHSVRRRSEVEIRFGNDTRLVERSLMI